MGHHHHQHHYYAQRIWRRMSFQFTDVYDQGLSFVLFFPIKNPMLIILKCQSCWIDAQFSVLQSIPWSFFAGLNIRWKWLILLLLISHWVLDWTWNKWKISLLHFINSSASVSVWYHIGSTYRISWLDGELRLQQNQLRSICGKIEKILIFSDWFLSILSKDFQSSELRKKIFKKFSP